MIMVIETNIYDQDFQSRVIEVESWESYVEEIKNKIAIKRSSVIGHCYGISIPKECIISDLVVTNYKLSCIITTVTHKEIRHLVYKV